MVSRRPEHSRGRRCLAPLLAFIALPFAAVASAAAQDAPATFTAPDGSRFVLIVDATIPQVQWAVASWADGQDDPPGLEGLAKAAARCAQNGTWRTGSRDVDRERDALAEQAAVWPQVLANPADPAVVQRARELDDLCQQLFDATVFPRLLAAAPSHLPELVEIGPACVLVLTTLPAAIGEVGRLLVERREEQPLRRLPPAWLDLYTERLARHATDASAALRAEVLALTMPSHPMCRLLQPPAVILPTREQALATWARSQRPERTVHVLLGDFDVASTKAVLTTTFASTALPPYDGPAAVPPRPLAGVRRSVVPGARRPTVAVGWVLPEIADSQLLSVAATWFAGGQDSLLGRELQRASRANATLRWQAPWPPATNGQSLLLVEVIDDTGITGLADLVLRIARGAAATPPDAGTLAATLASLQRTWREQNTTPRQLAVTLAVAALQWPQQAPSPAGPVAADAKAVQALLARIVAGQPVVIEGKP
jgi:predicted Zn-dependent peptidase